MDPVRALLENRKTKTIRVRCTFVLDVEVPDHPDYDAQFDIEENHCPGTGSVGAALEAAIAFGREHGICWACPSGGKNEIVNG